MFFKNTNMGINDHDFLISKIKQMAESAKLRVILNTSIHQYRKKYLYF